MVLTSTSSRVRETLCQDGGLERLVEIVKESQNPEDPLSPYKWHLGLQCLLNVSARGSSEVRSRIIEADVVPVVATILDNYLAAREEWVASQESRLPCQTAFGEYQMNRDRNSSQERSDGNSSDRDSSQPSQGQSIDSSGHSPPHSQTHSQNINNPNPSQAANTITSNHVPPLPQSQNQVGLVQQIPQLPNQTQNTLQMGVQPPLPPQNSRFIDPILDHGVLDTAMDVDPDPNQLNQLNQLRSNSEVSLQTRADSNDGIDQSEEVREQHLRSLFSQATGQFIDQSRDRNGSSDLEVRLNPELPNVPEIPLNLPQPIQSHLGSNGLEPLVAAGMPVFSNGRLVPREQDVCWALEIIAFVSKHPQLRRIMQETHYLPQISLRKKSDIVYSHTEEKILPVNFEHSPDSVLPLPDWEREYYFYNFDNNVDMCEQYGAKTFNLFELVEKFTAFRSPRDFPYWACLIMRNFVRKDDGGIRQCANFLCGKWEDYPRQFAKCRRCKRTKYCSKACQLRAWTMHRCWCTVSQTSSHNNHSQNSGSGSSSLSYQNSSQPSNSNATQQDQQILQIQVPSQEQILNSTQSEIDISLRNGVQNGDLNQDQLAVDQNEIQPQLGPTSQNQNQNLARNQIHPLNQN